jgi:hypothetical protein
MVTDVPAGIVAALKEEAAMQVHIAAIPAMIFEYFMLYEHEPDPKCQGDW